MASESWENLIRWGEGDELHDPLFGELPGPSASLFDYTVSAQASAAPSVADGPSPIANAFSFTSFSPSYSTTATSPPLQSTDFNQDSSFSPRGVAPLIGHHEGISSFTQLHSFETASSQTSDYTDSPTVNYSFRPFSQAFENVGSWADQPQFRGSLWDELEHHRAINIQPPNPRGYNSYYSSLPLIEEQPIGLSHPRALTVPQSIQGQTPHEPAIPPLAFQSPLPTALSISSDQSPVPDTTLYHPSVTASSGSITGASPVGGRPIGTHSRPPSLSRTLSRSDSRRSRGGPSQSFGFVHYEPNQQTNRLVPAGADSGGGRRRRGRTQGLTPEARQEAAVMRLVGSCTNCKRRKEKCDPGNPCQSCLNHFKDRLPENPCRRQPRGERQGAN